MHTIDNQYFTIYSAIESFLEMLNNAQNSTI
ncbi:MAG: hypothetical protein ACI9Y7_001716 [Dokdonia sp.]|jgi:hypothetical protein